jgi:antitoxin component YwqK of YwqJK toxin-antitoxin module
MQSKIKIEYHENGMIKSEHQEIDNGQFNGLHFGYYDNGNRKYKNLWINNFMQGTSEFWNKNGTRYILQQLNSFSLETASQGIKGIKIEFKY